MREWKRTLVKWALFLVLVTGFAWESFASFKKYIQGDTSLSITEVLTEPEPMPTISICGNPPFNTQFLKSMNASPNLFQPTFDPRMNIFPESLDDNSNPILYQLWQKSAFIPLQIMAFDGLPDDDEISFEFIINNTPIKDLNQFQEIEDVKIFNSIIYGSCTSIIWKKPRSAGKPLTVSITTSLPLVHNQVVIILHETPPSQYGMISGFLSPRTAVESINFGQMTLFGIGRQKKFLSQQRKRGLCKEYGKEDSQELCRFKETYLPLIKNDPSAMRSCAKLGWNITHFCLIPQLYNVWLLWNQNLTSATHCTTIDENLCMKYLMFKNYVLDVPACPDPCTQVILNSRAHATTEMMGMNDTAIISIFFETNRVTVMEEYLIFDNSAIIAAIGGLLGLFLGFSFYQCCLGLLGQASADCFKKVKCCT